MKISAMNEFTQEFKKIIDAHEENFNTKTVLKSCVCWDSLAVVSTMAMIDMYFGVKMQGQDIETCQTLEDIFHKVQEKES